MKRFFIAVLIGLLFSQVMYAQRYKQRSFIEFKFGQLDPADASIGNLFGVATGRTIDDRLSWGIELDVYKSTFRRQTTVAEFDSAGITFREKRVELEFTTTIIPVYFLLNYELPLGGRTNPFRFRASGGIGWEFIWNHENNFKLDIERKRFFNGLGWHLSTGMGLKISQAGVLFFDVVYNDATVTRNQDRNQQGLPIFQVMDVSGFGFLFGINIAVRDLF